MLLRLIGLPIIFLWPILLPLMGIDNYFNLCRRIGYVD